MPFEGNSILGLVNRLRGAFYHRNDRTMTVYGLRVNAAAKTADYTMLASDYVITVACSSANITITLPDAATSAGQIYTVVKTDATEYTVVIDPAGADTINGLGAYSMFGQYAAASFFSNGTAWYFAPRQRDDIYQAKTSNYTLGKFDGAIECTSGTFALTLPTAVGAVGRIYRLKNTGAGTITINTTSAQTVDAYASGALTLAQYDAYAVMSNGANWIILGKVGAAGAPGSATYGNTEIDFGATPVADGTFTITDAACAAGSDVIAQVRYTAPTGKDLDELEMDQLYLMCTPGAGQFDLYARAIDGSYLEGTFVISYTLG